MAYNLNEIEITNKKGWYTKIKIIQDFFNFRDKWREKKTKEEEGEGEGEELGREKA